ncbi:MAG: MBL fold metallo-hydrolase, partial [Chitinophagaceae bacterium]|nr:MBL fold metallo-hydrolase [Chitinophagaceae bacterium]
PTAAHIPLPYVMGYDMFPMTTIAEKETFLKEAIDKKYILYFEHDTDTECCDVIQTEKGFAKGAVHQIRDF